jgi:hypothetical protein
MSFPNKNFENMLLKTENQPHLARGYYIPH